MSLNMILQFPNFLALSFASLITFLAIYYQRKNKSQADHGRRSFKLPPGPRKLPIIGNLHQLAGQLPHRRLTDLAKQYGALMHLQLGEIPVLVISSPEMARATMKTHNTSFANRGNLLAADIMSYNYSALAFTPHGDHWRKMRKLCVTEILSTKRVLRFRSVREEEVWNMIGSLSRSSQASLPVNLSERLFSLTNDVTSRAVFGKRFKGQGELLSLAKEARKFTGGFAVADLFPSLGTFLGYTTGLIPALKRLHGKLDKVIEDAIDDHRAMSTPGDDDIIDILLRVAEPGESELQFKNNHIKALALDMLSGGSESSTATLEWAMTELVRNPGAMRKAQVEIREVLKGKSKVEEKDIGGLVYLRAIVKETLRIHPPGTLIPRESREQCEIAGYNIPAKTKVVVNAWAIGRDIDYWTEAESFKPERFLEGRDINFHGTGFEYIPFGGGGRVCPGISFALSTIELALSQLLYHFDWEIPNGSKPEELDATELFGLTCTRKNDLCLIPVIRIPFQNSSVSDCRD